MVRTLVTSCCIAAPIVFATSAVGVHAVGQSWPRSILFSLFVTFWGGLGFGCMFGSVIWATRLEAETDSAPVHARRARTSSEPAEPTLDAIGKADRPAGAEVLRPTG